MTTRKVVRVKTPSLWGGVAEMKIVQTITKERRALIASRTKRSTDEVRHIVVTRAYVVSDADDQKHAIADARTHNSLCGLHSWSRTTQRWYIAPMPAIELSHICETCRSKLSVDVKLA